MDWNIQEKERQDDRLKARRSHDVIASHVARMHIASPLNYSEAEGTMDTPPRRGPSGGAGGGAKRQKIESMDCPSSSRNAGTLAIAESPEVESPQAKPGAITDGDKKGDDAVSNPVLDAESPEVESPQAKPRAINCRRREEGR